jgi:hypothetical protein
VNTDRGVRKQLVRTGAVAVIASVLLAGTPASSPQSPRDVGAERVQELPAGKDEVPGERGRLGSHG